MVIVKIDTSLFSKLGIKDYDVNKMLVFRESDIAIPEDNEITLVYEKDGKFPSEIVVGTIKYNSIYLIPPN